jgi:hypothetical protein
MHTIAAALEGVEIGLPEQYQNLAVYPLLEKIPNTHADYLLLDDALAAGFARVTEVTEGGSVPDLAFANLATRPILLVDGDELIGAKQNRILNMTILVAAGRQVTIPVSCVERGRWAYKSRHFGAAKHKLYLKARAMNAAQVSESLSDRGERRSDQRAIWRDIDLKMARMQARSPTDAMADIYEQKSSDISGYLAAFEARPQQCGAVFVINGQVAGVELFDSTNAFARYFRKLLSSYALDAIDVEQPRPGVLGEAAAYRFLEEIRNARQQDFPAIGEGTDIRLAGERLAGGALRVGEHLVHLAAFRLDEPATGEDEKPMVA